jgi:bifunctional non-homologous end joining protein LigD
MLPAPKIGFIRPCLPSGATQPPTGTGWLHEIKQDGYRMMPRRDAGGVRLLTRKGHDWSDRYPAIASAIGILACRSCLIDGEVIMAGPDGIAQFEELRRGERKKPRAQLYAFDLIELDGVDLRREPIEVRKAALQKLIKPTRAHNDAQRALLKALIFSDYAVGDGEKIFRHACHLGYEGIVSKLRSSLYTSGRTRDWIKSKNPEHPAFRRVLEEDWNG